MKRLGEDVFKFVFGFNMLWMLFVLGFSIFSLFFFFISLDINAGLAIFFFIFSVVIGYLFYLECRLINSGVILDKEKWIVVIHKWTWSVVGPQKYEEIKIDEIMGVQRDINVTTETKLRTDYEGRPQWQTTETKEYNVVLQGKFGSKRFKLHGKDDWDLFMTLLYGEG
jgi:hypothetical protein